MIQHGAVELKNKGDSSTFLVNGQRVNYSFSKNMDRDDEALTLNDE